MFFRRRPIGFTLLEFAATVTIIGLLAAVAVPSYRKYLKRTHLTEGFMELRKIYELEYVFGMRDETHGLETTPCTRVPRFSRLCSCVLAGTSSTANYYHILWRPPKGEKSKRRVFFGSVASTPEDKPGPGWFYVKPWCKQLWGSFLELRAASYWYPCGCPLTHKRSEFLEPGYFLFRAHEDPNIRDAYNVPDIPGSTSITDPLTGGRFEATNTMTVWGIADLDGDYVYPDENSPGGGSTSGFTCDKSPLAVTNSHKVTIIGRSLYYKNGEIFGVPGVIEYNPGE